MKMHQDRQVNAPLGKGIAMVVAATAVLLLIPAIAMQLTDAVRWGPGDFAAAAMLLAGTGIAYLVAARQLRTGRQRIAVGLALALLLALVWAELAVGLFS